MARKDALKNIREQLLQRRDALRQALAGDDSLLRDMNQQSGGDVVDFAIDSAYGEITSQLAEVASRELVNLEIALKLIAAGKYGVCESCGASIALARLQALPYATTCIDCQRESESSTNGNRHSVNWSRLIDTPTDDLRINDLDFNIS